jgi:putative autotransporter adhesin-like protein
MNENTKGHVSESKVRPFRILTTEGMFLMKKIATISLAACVVLTAGCRWIGIRGNGNVKTEERTIGAFANIDASGVFTIEWQNGAPALRITIDENLLPYVNSHISGDTLRLRVREQIWPTHGIKVVVSSPTRAGARISGAVRLTAKQLNGPKFAFEARGASHVALDGKIEELLADMTGASELEASGLQTKTVEISTTGAGDAEIAVSDTLKVAITGAGKVTYSGNPQTIEKHISGAGSIRHKE